MKTHNKSRSLEHSIWCAMKSRCYNKKHKNYDLYGGRGIKVCDRWLNSFENFILDMGLKPSKKHSLDRFPDKNGYYEPKNCRWATQKQQVRNQNRTIIIDFKGEKRLLIDVCEEIGASPTVVRDRIRKGWIIDFALFAPKNSTYKTLLKSKINP